MTVTFFGHRDVPKEIEPTLRKTLTDLIENHNANELYVGNNGKFDAMVRRQLEDLSEIYDINYSIVLAYMPCKKNEYDNFTNTIFPEGIETAPKRLAICKRNEWMTRQSDIVVTYVTRNFGGAWKFKTLSEKQGEIIIELSE